VSILRRFSRIGLFAAVLLSAVLGLAARAPAEDPQQPVFSEPWTGPPAAADASSDRLARADWLRDTPAAKPPVEPTLSMTERATALVRGRVQLEGGYAMTYDRQGGTQVVEHYVPDMLLRVGLTRRLELRIGWPGWYSTDSSGALGDSTQSGTLDPNVGFMFDLCPQKRWRPQMAVLASVPITLRGSSFASEGLQPLSQIIYRWQPTDRLAWGGATGMALFRDGGDHYTQFQQSINFDYALGDRWGAFAEWEMLVDYGSIDDGTQHLLGGGLGVLLGDRWQLSWRLGIGLNARAPDFLTGVRFAVRF